jgi:hypothetical protein
MMVGVDRSEDLLRGAHCRPNRVDCYAISEVTLGTRGK